MHMRAERRQVLLLLLPYTLGLLGLVVVPVLLTLPLAFADSAGFGALRWAGLANLRRLVADPVFPASFWATLGLVAIAAPARGLAALLLAALLEQPGTGRGLLRRSLFIPTAMPEAAQALLWLAIFNPLWGPFNALLPLFGYRPDAWLLEPAPARVALAIALCWSIGEGVLLMLAARRSVPPQLYEAAALDGAGRLARFATITWPLLRPFQLLLLCRDIVVVLGGSLAAAMLITRGGPYYATTYLPLWAYRQLTDFGFVGYAATLSLVLFALTAAPIALLVWLSRRWLVSDV